jgi:hypothetical protein
MHYSYIFLLLCSFALNLNSAAPAAKELPEKIEHIIQNRVGKPGLALFYNVVQEMKTIDAEATFDYESKEKGTHCLIINHKKSLSSEYIALATSGQNYAYRLFRSDLSTPGRTVLKFGPSLQALQKVDRELREALDHNFAVLFASSWSNEKKR